MGSIPTSGIRAVAMSRRSSPQTPDLMPELSSRRTTGIGDDSDLLARLERRFAAHLGRHRGIAWEDVLLRLKGSKRALHTLRAMEDSDGEPDVIGRDAATGDLLVVDCAAESPAGRRSLCYDGAAQASRKDVQPAGNVIDAASAMGVSLLTEAEYRALQALGEFDTKTSSWIATPADIRARGGALFCDRRYGNVFTYHNGAQSFYAGRGFRGMLRV